jgi:hypothetical protein
VIRRLSIAALTGGTLCAMVSGHYVLAVGTAVVLLAVIFS